MEFINTKRFLYNGRLDGRYYKNRNKQYTDDIVQAAEKGDNVLLIHQWNPKTRVLLKPEDIENPDLVWKTHIWHQSRTNPEDYYEMWSYDPNPKVT